MLVIYNGIPLLDAKLNSHEIEPVYDSSDQDFLFERHVINLTCLINPNRISGLGEDRTVDGKHDWVFSQLPGLPAGRTAREIIKALDQPRKPLKAYSGTELVLESPSFPVTFNGGVTATTDCNSGPKVRRCAILKDMGNHGILINFVVEACRRECPQFTYEDGVNKYSPIISNRYTQTHDVDSQFFTSIKTEGITLFRTDLLDIWQKTKKVGYDYPDYFRKFVIPRVPTGFQRKAINVSVVPGRNALMWSVVDREMPYYLGDKQTNPWHVVDFNPVFSMSFMKEREGAAAPAGMMHFQCTAVGSNLSTIWGLTSFCLMMAYSKCKIGLYKPDEILIRDLSITQRHMSRSVDISMAVQVTPSNNRSLPAVWEDFIKDDRFPKLLEKNGVCPKPPYGEETRGTHKYMIVANEIASTVACGKISRPKVPDEYTYYLRGFGEENTPPGGGGTLSDIADPTSTPRSSSPSNSSRAASVNPILDATSQTTTINGISVTTGILDDFPEYDSVFRERSSWYPTYKIFVKWETHRGRLLMPVCGGAAIRQGSKRLSIIDTCTPYQVKKISWEGTRIGKWPEIPNPYTVASTNSIADETLLDDEITLGSPVATPDGRSLVWSAKGTYTYAMQRSFRTAGVDNFENALVPWVSGKVRDTYLPPQAFVRHVTEPFPQPKNDDKVSANFGAGTYSDKPGDWGPQPKGGWDIPTVDGRR